MAIIAVPTYIRTRSKPPISPMDCGAIADGSSHVLSTRYGSLAAAQADYPFAIALSQEIDYCACKLASNLAFGADGSEHASTNAHLNRPLYLPSGKYFLGADRWLIRNLVGGVIEGDGRLSTVVMGSAGVLAFDGIWYTRISGIYLSCTSSSGVAALELDGNVPGHPYATRGVQAVTLQDMLIDGGGALYCVTMTRLGSNAQGSECLFINCHFSNASFACYHQTGFNALANTFIGGNFQSYDKAGAYAVSGTMSFFNTGFQSTKGYLQVENDGWDIRLGAGAGEGCEVRGCRSESLRFLNNLGNVRVAVSGIKGNAALPGWVANTAYGAAAPAYKAILEGGRLFVATTEGTSGADEPTWASVADGGTVNDGGIVWTETPFDAIRNLLGSVDLQSTAMSAGRIVGPHEGGYKRITASYTITPHDRVVVCDTTSNAITVTFPVPETFQRGRQITLIKPETGANAITVTSGIVGFESVGGNYTIPGGARKSVTFTYGESTGGTIRWIPNVF